MKDYYFVVDGVTHTFRGNTVGEAMSKANRALIDGDSRHFFQWGGDFMVDTTFYAQWSNIPVLWD